MTYADQIMERTRARIEAYRPELERSGGSIQQRNDVYRLRIRSEDPVRGRVHRSIELGDDNAAYAAQLLIDEWRREYDAAREVLEDIAAANRQRARLMRLLKRDVLARAAGPSQRRRLAHEFNDAADDPQRMIEFLQDYA